MDFKPYYTEIKWRCLNTPQNWFYFYKAFPLQQEKRKKFVYDNAKHFRLRSFQDAVAFLMIAEGEDDEKLAVNTITSMLDKMLAKNRIQALEILKRSLRYAGKPLNIGDMPK